MREASRDLKQLELVDQVDRTDKAAATVQDLVAECTAAQNERDAARARATPSARGRGPTSTSCARPRTRPART